MTISDRCRLEVEVGLTNEALADHEESVVREMLSGALDNLGELNLQITRLQSRLYSLTQRRTAEVERVSRYRTALAPEKKVPPEILAEIFFHCIPQKPIMLPPWPRDSHWIILRVCSRWRQVALQESKLWTFRLPGISNLKAQERHPSAIDDFLAALPYSKISFSDYGARTLNLLARYSMRIREMQMEMSHNVETIARLRHPPYIRFEALESVRLVYERHISNLPESSFAAAPNLRKVHCLNHTGHPIATNHSTYPMPWAQLTHLTFEHMSPPLSSLLEILKQTVQLVKFTLIHKTTFLEDSFLTNEALPQVLLPNLHSLCLELITINNFGVLLSVADRLLDHLTLPSLKSLTMNGLVVDSSSLTYTCKGLISLIRRSQCRLHTFFLAYRTKEREIKQLLAVMPTLVVLRSEGECSLSSSVFESIMRDDLVPKLAELWCTLPAESPEACLALRSFTALVKVRAAQDTKSGCTGLERGRLQYYGESEWLHVLRGEFEDLDSQITKGIKIHISNQKNPALC